MLGSDVSRVLVRADQSLREAMTCIDRNAKGIALMIDDAGHLLAAITDGDIRRAILAGTTLDSPIERLVERKESSPYPKPITALQGTDTGALLTLMQKHAIRQIPLVDEEGRVVDLITSAELLPDEVLPVQALVMAGGAGSRLRPLTQGLPKPMLPVGDRPLLERIIGQLQAAGIRSVNISTHYMPEKIIEHFGDGRDFGVDVTYVSEDQPLGTAGAVALVESPTQPLLVMNGDILTRVDIRSMLAFHTDHDADVTVGVRQYDLQVPYGVLECEGASVRRIREKPTYNFFVNAGIYLLKPSVQEVIPSGRPFDMTDLIEKLVAEARTVVSYPIVEYWLDIGHPADYERAQADLLSGSFAS